MKAIRPDAQHGWHAAMLTKSGEVCNQRLCSPQDCIGKSSAQK
jgi:hypothetical protein